jgi:sulfate permease, SulP family
MILVTHKTFMDLQKTPPSPWHIGFQAALATVVMVWPVSLALGSFAWSPLGASAASAGATAGLIGAALAGVIGAALGERGSAVAVPRSVTGVFVAALVTSLSNAGLPSEARLPATALMLMLTGLMLIIMGRVGVGSLVRYCPQSVVAGFMHAMAVLLAWAQLPGLLGLPSQPSWSQWSAGQVDSVALLAPAVAAVALMWALRPPALARFGPPALGALVVATALHHAGVALGFRSELGGTLGILTAAWPDWSAAWQAAQWVLQPSWGEVISLVWPLALALAALTAMDHLLSARAFESVTQEPSDPRTELMRLGASQALTAGLGCVPCSIGLTSSQARWKAGGGGWRAAVLAGAMLVALSFVVGPLSSFVPQAALSGLLLSVAWRLVDRRMVDLAKSWWRARHDGHRAAPLQLLGDLATCVVVTTVAVWWGMLAGVAMGALLAVLWFIAATRASVVRSVRRGSGVSSRRVWSAGERDRLRGLSEKIVAVELEGILYFGTAHHLLSSVESRLRSPVGAPTHVILDWRRIRYVDFTGVEAVKGLRKRLEGQGIKLWFCNLDKADAAKTLLALSGVSGNSGGTGDFEDLDRAVEAAELELLGYSTGNDEVAELEPYEISPWNQLDPDVRNLFLAHLERRQWPAGSMICAQGEPGGELFFIARGSASVYRQSPVKVQFVMDSRAERLVSFRAGACLGELSFLDGGPRDASVVADQPVVCWVLKRTDIDSLLAHQPAAVATFYRHLAREVSDRLRATNRSLDALRP